jgi:hypothetical protein
VHGKYVIQPKKIGYVRMPVERGYLRTETESEITAAQDQASQTKYHLKELLRTVTDCK